MCSLVPTPRTPPSMRGWGLGTRLGVCVCVCVCVLGGGGVVKIPISDVQISDHCCHWRENLGCMCRYVAWQHCHRRVVLGWCSETISSLLCNTHLGTKPNSRCSHIKGSEGFALESYYG